MTRRVVLLVYPRFQMLDLTGPYEVFSLVDQLVPARDGARAYQVEVVAATLDPVPSSSGLAVTPHRTLAAALADPTPIDTVIAVGGDGTRAAMQDTTILAWIRAASRTARRTASVCSGALILAEAGLLDGRKATTHWSVCEVLADRYPAVDVQADPIFVKDGDVWTSAGVTAGMDLAMAMAEEDLGAETARTVARQLVVFVQRPGGQAQFSTQLAAQRPSRDVLREVQDWIADHLDDDLTLAALASRAALSERHFSRVFRAETGRTVASYVEAARVEAARRLLESTDDGLDRIARTCGFGTVETMHRTFHRTVRVTPGEYRKRFSRGLIIRPPHREDAP